MAFNYITAEEAAEMIKNGDSIGTSGFTAPGSPKFISQALAAKAEREHAAGREFKVNVFTGASTSDKFDGVLARANAINMRAPYQNLPDLRKRINCHDAHYFDRHLSEMAQEMRYGFYGKLDYAIIEAAHVSPDGEIVIGCGCGNVATYAALADKIFIELNSKLPESLLGMHDIYTPLDPPCRREIPIYRPNDRVGSPVLKVDPAKIVGIVRTDSYDGVKPFSAPDEVSKQIGGNVVSFLISEYESGRLPKEFLPLQSGVGNVANAVLYDLGESTRPVGECHGTCRCKGAFALLQQFKHRVLNHFGIHHEVGQAGAFAEVVEHSVGHIAHPALQRKGGDFTRNSFLSIFSCPSVSKGGVISNIVPMVAHCDHSEHSVDIVVTDQGVADLRHKDPVERAEEIINNCAHPDYRPLLLDYLRAGKNGQTPHTLCAAYEFHNAFNETGDMRNADFGKYF